MMGSDGAIRVEILDERGGVVWTGEVARQSSVLALKREVCSKLRHLLGKVDDSTLRVFDSNDDFQSNRELYDNQSVECAQSLIVVLPDAAEIHYEVCCEEGGESWSGSVVQRLCRTISQFKQYLRLAYGHKIGHGDLRVFATAAHAAQDTGDLPNRSRLVTLGQNADAPLVAVVSKPAWLYYEVRFEEDGETCSSSVVRDRCLTVDDFKNYLRVKYGQRVSSGDISMLANAANAAQDDGVLLDTEPLRKVGLDAGVPLVVVISKPARLYYEVRFEEDGETCSSSVVRDRCLTVDDFKNYLRVKYGQRVSSGDISVLANAVNAAQDDGVLLDTEPLRKVGLDAGVPLVVVISKPARLYYEVRLEGGIQSWTSTATRISCYTVDQFKFHVRTRHRDKFRRGDRMRVFESAATVDRSDAEMRNEARLADAGLRADSRVVVIVSNLVVWSQAIGCPLFDITSGDEVVHLPIEYLQHSGVSLPGQCLYRRADVSKVWSAIQSFAIDTYATLWVVGASGSGKSCAAFAFACGGIDRCLWDILWVHLDQKKGVLQCMKLDRDHKKRTCTINISSHLCSLQIEELLSLSDHGRPMIVFFDGYQESKPLEPFLSWKLNGPQRHRLVIVTSMESASIERSFSHSYIPARFPISAAAGGVSDCVSGDEKKTVPSDEHVRILSWTLAEYVAAVRHEQFFKGVEYLLRERSVVPVDGTAEALVRAKYRVAGGSARLMFCSMADALAEIVFSMMRLRPYLAPGSGSSDSFGRLIYPLEAWHDTVNDTADWSQHTSHLMSRYAAHFFGVLFGPDVALRLRKCRLGWSTQWIGLPFEAWFFGMVGHSGIVLTRFLSAARRVEWPQRACQFVDLCDGGDCAQYLTSADVSPWLIPRTKEEGGFDAVCVNGECAVVTFVQLPSKQRSLHARSFSTFLVRVQERLGCTKPYHVELYLVVPLCWKPSYRARVDRAAFQRDVVDVAFAQLPLCDAGDCVCVDSCSGPPDDQAPFKSSGCGKRRQRESHPRAVKMPRLEDADGRGERGKVASRAKGLVSVIVVGAEYECG